MNATLEAVLRVGRLGVVVPAPHAVFWTSINIYGVTFGELMVEVRLTGNHSIVIGLTNSSLNRLEIPAPGQTVLLFYQSLCILMLLVSTVIPCSVTKVESATFSS